jgi:uncharacterized protein (UPF0128 family)
MDYFKIIVILFIGLSYFATLIINFQQKKIIELQKQKLDELYKVLDHEGVLTEFYLKHALNDSIEKEDYQTATKCRDLLKQLEESKSKK